MLAILLVLPLIYGSLADVGVCNRTTEPLSWLETHGQGLEDWSSAGVKAVGPNYCLVGSKQTATLAVAYHMNISADAVPVKMARPTWNLDANGTQNGCLNQDPRIKYCFSFCTADLENLVTRAALKFRVAYQLAADVFEEYGSPSDVAVTTIEVSLTDPAAHLDVQVFMLPCWCSVYVGIDPDFGSPYLYEVQIAHLLSS
ncbi:unnamed protein product, partial [Mesorhabditis spiculigera]